MQDIESCVSGYDTTGEQVEERARGMNYAGGDKVFIGSLKTVMDKIFN